jgi:hypothetical protein
MQDLSNGKLAGVYPREYRPSGFWKITTQLCTVAAVCGGGAGLWYAVVGQFNDLTSRILVGGVLFLFVPFGIYTLLSLSRSRVVLFPDRISVEELRSTRAFDRNDLLGWRIMPNSPPCLVLQPKDKHLRAVKIALMFPLDDFFEEWLDALPSLDIEDEETSNAEILDDQRLGATKAERSQALEKGKKRANIVTGISAAACILAFFYPKPYLPLMLLLMVLPWVAVAMVTRSRGLLRMDEYRNDAHPNVAVALLLPGIALMLRAVLDFEVIQSAFAIFLYVAIGSVLSLAAISADPSVRRKSLSVAGICVICMAYGYGATIEIDTLFDQAHGTGYSTIVQEKHISSGKHTTYNLKLGAWGPQKEPSNLEVSKETYEPIQKGDVVLLTLKPGALRVPWFYMRAWQEGETPRSSR